MLTKYSLKNDTKNSNRTIPSGLTSDISTSEVHVKPSPVNRARKAWLTITLGLIAVAGILGTVSVTVVALLVLHQTTTTRITSTPASTTDTSNTTGTICFITPSPRPSNTWYVVDTMSTPRYLHTSTLLSQDNSVLLAGGFLTTTALISTEKYIPSTGCFQTARDMPRARRSHTADILSAFPDYILFAGGVGSTGGIWNVADLFNPITGNTLSLSLTASRYAHASAVFGSSQVVLVGGMDSTTYLSTGDAMISGSTATFYSTTNNMSVGRTDHTATRLGNNSGVVLVAGGRNNGAYYPYSEIYYGASNIFFPLGAGGSMSSARAYHTATYLPPPYDKVLITGGFDGATYQNTMSLFDVATLSMTTLTTTMSSRRCWHTATLLPNGKVLVVAGSNSVIATTSCDLIDPSNNYLTTAAGNINTGRYQHTATLIPNGNNSTVLICGGIVPPSNILTSCELYYI